MIEARQKIKNIEKINNKLSQQQELDSEYRDDGLKAIIKYLDESQWTKEEPYNDIQFNVNHALLCASLFNRLDDVKYLLTSNDLPIKAQADFFFNSPITKAIIVGNIEVVEYLLKSPDLQINASFSEGFDDIVEEILYYTVNATASSEKYEKALDYLIYDYKMNPTEYIEELIKKTLNEKYSKMYIEQLHKNKLYDNLQNELKQNNVSTQVKL